MIKIKKAWLFSCGWVFNLRTVQWTDWAAHISAHVFGVHLSWCIIYPNNIQIKALRCIAVWHCYIWLYRYSAVFKSRSSGSGHRIQHSWQRIITTEAWVGDIGHPFSTSKIGDRNFMKFHRKYEHIYIYIYVCEYMNMYITLYQLPSGYLT